MPPVGDPRNKWGEVLEVHADITLNLEYWDCDCEQNYIHHYTVEQCSRCGADSEEFSNSRENEVEAARNGEREPFRTLQVKSDLGL